MRTGVNIITVFFDIDTWFQWGLSLLFLFSTPETADPTVSMKAFSNKLYSVGVIVGFSTLLLDAKTTLPELPLLNRDSYFQQRGNHSVDGWNTLSAEANPNGGSWANSDYMWPAYAAQYSEGTGGQRADLVKVSNAPDGDGGPYFASSSIYFWGATSSTESGTLAVKTDSPLNDLSTLTLQLEFKEAELRDIYSYPMLTIELGDGTVVNLGFDFGGVIDRKAIGKFTPPNSGLPPQDMYANLWGFQWDVSNYTDISKVSISFSAVGHASLLGIQLDQSDHNFGGDSIFEYLIPVPEPSTYALLLGAGALGMLLLRRRRAN